MPEARVRAIIMLGNMFVLSDQCRASPAKASVI